MDNLLKRIENYDDVIIFGYGNVGRHVYNQLKYDKVKAKIRFCDNNRHGIAVADSEVLTPQDAYLKYPNALFIIASIIYFAPMLAQLKSMGLTDENIVTDWIETNTRMQKRLYIETLPYHLTEHCNLKCAGCLHFSNLAKEQFADLNVFKKVFKRFVDIMGGFYKENLHIFGGEPLLHPQIEHFLLTARDIIPNGIISIITNGVILTKMPEKFWKTCNDTNTYIYISGYPVNINEAEIKQISMKYGVNFSFSSRDNNAWSQYVLDLNGNQDYKKSFSRCENANERFILKDRYLYPCSVTACIEHFNKAFNQKLDLQSGDYLDILSDINADDILSFLATPAPFCRYCDREKLKLGQTWRRSDFTINEYLD